MLTLKNAVKGTIFGLTASVIAACGSGEIPAPATTNNQTVTNQTVVTEQTVTEDTDLIVRNAAELSSMNLGANLNGIDSTADRSIAVKALMDIRAPALSKMVTQTTSDSATAKSKTRQATGHEKAVLDHMLPTLEGGNATRERTGNTILINPDEAYVCERWLTDEPSASESISQCIELLSELTVRIDATSDDTGTLTYLFSGQDVLAIEYAPAQGSYELYLPGAKTVIEKVAVISGNTSNLPDTMTGALKLSAVLNNGTPGEESGRLALAATQPITIESSANSYQFNLGNSTLFDVSADAQSGDGSVSIEVNNMNLSVADLIGAESTSMTVIDLPQFTIDADVTSSGTEVSLSNFGLGRGPFTVTVDNNEFIRFALATFSAKYNDLTRNLEFSENLDLQFALNHSRAAFGWFADGSSIDAGLSAAAGTILQQQLNDSVKVSQGGPFHFTYNYVDDFESYQLDQSFTTGQCFQDSAELEGFELVNCN